MQKLGLCVLNKYVQYTNDIIYEPCNKAVKNEYQDI